MRQGLLSRKNSLFRLGKTDVWIFLILLAGKLAWWAWWGILCEADSVSYLADHYSFLHPPGYFLFAHAFSYVGGIGMVILAQSLVFAFTFTLLNQALFSSLRFRYGSAVFLALDPFSGMLNAGLMSESLFLSCVALAIFLWIRIREEGQEYSLRFLIPGLALGLAGWMRFAAMITLIAWVLWILSGKEEFKVRMSQAALIVFGFLVMLFPFRLYASLSPHAGTWSPSIFRNLSLWNASAWMFPGSEWDQPAQQGLYAYLSNLEEEKFSKVHTWQTGHIFFEDLPFKTWCASYSLTLPIEAFHRAEFQVADSLGSLSIQLIATQPLRYVSGFVLPNWVRPFHVEEHTETRVRNAFLNRKFGFVPEKEPYYQYPAGIAAFLFAMVCLVLSILKGDRRNYLLFFCALFFLSWFLSAWGAVLFLRFVYTPMCFLFLALPIVFQGHIDRKMI